MSTAYDQTQYESYAYSQTHPEHLYTLAKLFDVHAPDFKKAKVLELGTASGGNLIPMAYNLPESQFLGIDLSAKQIEEGQTLVDTLKLKNIELRAQSILDFEPSEGQFDYIICHGILSWVPPEVQDKILSIFEHNLSENGVAYISYNTMPGWSMVKSIRDMMLYHTQGIEDPKQKAGQARALLNFISEGLEGEQTSYADFLKVEINLLKNQPDSYLLHDHLEEDNTPMYFHELIEKSSRHHLNYLSDANLVSMFAGNLPPQFANEIAKVKNIVVANQYIDFIRNQRFRSTLLCHKKVNINRNLNSFCIENFYLSYAGVKIALEEKDLADGVEVKFKNTSVTLTTSHQVSKVAIKILMDSPRPMSYHKLLEFIEEKCPQIGRRDLETLLNNDLNLLRLVLGGLLMIHSSEGDYVTQTDSKPKTSKVALALVKSKNYVINQRHEVVALNPLEKLLLQAFDGKQTKKKIVDDLVGKAKKGLFQVVDKNENILTEEKDLQSQINVLYQHTLNKFIQCALMIH